MGIYESWTFERIEDLADMMPDSTVLNGLIVVVIFAFLIWAMVYARILLLVIGGILLFIELCHWIGRGHSSTNHLRRSR